jgi:hypothetical protein
MNRNRLNSAVYFLAPIALALILYWPGLNAWFQLDDFALLSFRSQVHDWPSLLHTLFAPIAQGTIRTLSERVYYLGFTSLFGIHAFPFRVWVFLTFFAALPILSLVTIRLTGSRTAGFWAPILWIVNSGVAVTLSWTAIYYEDLLALVFIANLWLLLRYVETDRLRYYVAQCVIFILGFGVIEINVVYPALAATYAILAARRLLPKVLPLFLVSGAYTIVHFMAVHLPAAGPYTMHWDRSIFSTLQTYWSWALGPRRLAALDIGTPFLRSTAAVILSLALLVFVVYKLRQRQWIVALFPAWFLITLAPLLPLREHVTDYYLTIPMIGLAMLGAWAVASAWHARRVTAIAGTALLILYIGASIPVSRFLTRSYYDRSQRARTTILGVVEISRGHPGKAVLLSGVDPELFHATVLHHPFTLYGLLDISLLPEDATPLRESAPWLDTSGYFAEANAVRFALARDRAIVIDVSHGAPRDITAQYIASANIQPGDAIPARVDAGSEATAEQLGPEWYPMEKGFRWMAKRATVKLRGPSSPGARLYLAGFCPAAILKSGPVHVDVSVDHVHLAPATLSQPDARFSLSFDLPPQLSGRPAVDVAVELDHTFMPETDRRPLGLIFGTFEIR